MIALPGLNLTAQPTEPLNLPPTSSTRTQDLQPNTEYRFEVGFTRHLTVKLVTGTAEYFGTELAPATTYTFTGTKGAVFTWHGCKLELTGDPESEYVAEETQMMAAANVHFALEALRDRAAQTRDVGPRVLVVGPDNAGKTSLVKTLTAYAVKSGRQPMVVNLDPREGMLSVPGTFSAAAFSSILDIEEGWGSSPISGPSALPVKMPLVYQYGLQSADAEEGRVFRPLVTRVALAVTSRLEEDAASKSAGFVVDTEGGMAGGRGGAYDNVEHVISEFSINVILVLSSERLYSDLSRKYAPATTTRPGSSSSQDPIHIIRLDKSGGCVDRPESYTKALRHAQIRAYFFGHTGEAALAPHSQAAGFDELSIYRVRDDPPTDFTPHDPLSTPDAATLFERVAPSADLTNKLLAVTTAGAAESHAAIRDASVRGFVYVAEVDEARKRVKLLSPMPGGVALGALVVGRWPEDVHALVG